MKKLNLSDDIRKKILDRVQYYGLTGLGWLLCGLTRILFGPETWRGFSALSSTEWVRNSTRYSLPDATIAGIDKALKENLTPEEAVDRLARKAGISKREIKASFIGFRAEGVEVVLPPKTDIPALEAAIANSIKKS